MGLTRTVVNGVRAVRVIAACLLLAGASGIALALPNVNGRGALRTGAVPFAAPTPPLANGDAFQYAITQKVTYDYTGQPPTGYTATSGDMETVAYPVVFHRQKDAYKVQDIVTPTSSDTGGYTEESYLGFVPDGRLYALKLYGYDESFGSGSGNSGSESEITSKPYDVEAKYPESAGTHWSNNYAYQYRESDDENDETQSFRQAFQADGAYVETEHDSISGVTKWRLAADGTGTLFSQFPGQPATKDAFGLPQGSGSSQFIPVTSGSETTDVPDWYPGGGAPPLPLSNVADTVGEYGAAPKACGSMAGTPAYDVRETTNVLDPVAGDVFTETVHSYDSPSMGMVCSTDQIVQQDYDNTTYGKLYFTLTDDETYVLTGEQLAATHFGRAAPLHAQAWRHRMQSFLRPMPRGGGASFVALRPR